MSIENVKIVLIFIVFTIIVVIGFCLKAKDSIDEKSEAEFEESRK